MPTIILKPKQSGKSSYMSHKMKYKTKISVFISLNETCLVTSAPFQDILPTFCVLFFILKLNVILSVTRVTMTRVELQTHFNNSRHLICLHAILI